MLCTPKTEEASCLCRAQGQNCECASPPASPARLSGTETSVEPFRALSVDASQFEDEVPLWGEMVSLDTASLRQLLDLRDAIHASLASEPALPHEVTLFFDSGSALAGTTEQVMAILAARIDAERASLAKFDIDGNGMIDLADSDLFDILLDGQGFAGIEFSPLDFDGDKSPDIIDKCELLTKIGTVVAYD